MIIAFVLASQLAMTVETARSAARFVDSIGVNVHLSYWSTPYGARFPEVATLLERSGIRHVRDGMVLGQQRACDEARELAAHGIRFTYLTQPGRTQADLVTWATCTGDAIEAYEGPNEYDISHPKSDATWVATLQTFQKRLYGFVKSAPLLRRLPVIGPSLTSSEAYASVGDLSAYLDFGNIHDYFAGHEPGTPGWGLGGYGSIAYNMRVARAVSADKPIVATETGYGTDDASQNVPEDVQAAYVPRMFLDQFAAGIVRTYEYELVDEGGPPFAKLGLLRGDLHPKPAFSALTSTIALLGGGAAGATAQVPLDIGGDASGVRHLLLATSAGRCFLVIWQEAPSIEPKTRLPLPVATRNVTVRLGTGWVAQNVATFDAGSTLRTTSVAAGRPLSLSIRDRVTFVELRSH